MGEYNMSLTEEELIRALSMPTEAEDGLTIRELVEAFDFRFHRNTVAERLRMLIRQGQVEFAGWRNIPEITGRNHPRPVYRLKKHEELA